MSESIMALINLVRKRFDLFTKIFVLLFLLCLFADYLYAYYGVNILDFESILPQIVKVLLKKVEFILYWLIPFVCSIPGILFLILLIAYILEVIIKHVNVNIRMYNFDDVQCTVIPSVAYGFVTGMNLQLC